MSTRRPQTDKRAGPSATPSRDKGGTSRVAASRAPRTLEASTKEPVTPTTTLTTPASPSSNTARHPTTTLARSTMAHLQAPGHTPTSDSAKALVVAQHLGVPLEVPG